MPEDLNINHDNLRTSDGDNAGSRHTSSQIPQPQKIMEIFMRSLSEFTQLRGLSLSDLQINGQQIHPYKLYISVKKYGGYSQLTQKQRWGVIAQQFELSTNPAIAQQIASLYMKYIQPFELHLQPQRQSIQQSTDEDWNKGKLQSPPIKDGTSGLTYKNDIQGQRAIQGAAKTQLKNEETTEVTGAHMTGEGEQDTTQPTSTTKAHQVLSNEENLTQTDLQKLSVQNSGKISKISNQRPKPHIMIPTSDFLYVPQKRKIEYKGGYDIQVLSKYGTDADALSPEFPLFQELGTVNIHAITFALKSQNSGEIRQALDKLALVSSNPSQNIMLRECPGLADAIGLVGLDLLQILLMEQGNEASNIKSFSEEKAIHNDRVAEDDEPEEEEEEEENDNDLITNVFNAYHSWTSSDKDIAFHVDSLTGDPANPYLNIEAIETLGKSIQDDDTKFNDELNIPEVRGVKSTDSNSSPFGFPSYIDLLDLSKNELDTLSYNKRTNTSCFWKESLLDRLICVTMILRNLSFTDTNQSSIVDEPAVMKFLFGLIRALAETPDLIHLKRRQLSIHKDLITLLANLGLSIVFPSPTDAFCVLLFILSFSPEPNPFNTDIPSSNLKDRNIFFGEYNPLVHRYLGCAVDALAKLIPRDPPNRTYFNEIFLNTCTDEDYLSVLDRHLSHKQPRPYEFLTKAFVLVISTVPRSDFRGVPRPLESRIPLLQQSLLVAENLVSMIPDYGYFDDLRVTFSSVDIDSAIAKNMEQVLEVQKSFNVAFCWFEAVDGFGPTLLRASCILGAGLHVRAHPSTNSSNPFSNFSRRSASILRALGQKAMSFEITIHKKSQAENSGENGVSKSEYTASSSYLPPGILPTVETLFGALLTSDMNETVITQLSQLWEEGDDYIYSMMQNNIS